MDNKLNDNLKDMVDYWRQVKSGELPAAGPNEIDLTIWNSKAAIKRLVELEEQKEIWVGIAQAVGLKHDELKAKLATPVRLPKLSGDEDLAECVFKYVAAIRAAGFKVEGDA
ncbi:TPA: hypothetical protein ACGD4M_002726 [Serratia marcescens]